ncbi:cytochrome c oxidase subunit IV family [Bombardia bombarda]|uniref:Cytochrome c oxidase polypeptide V n=1 Tax=Bombardia bombarda TaxID=252184 RepID=A0AA40CET0_9PEZI|nr:cytochrome c oxidase subunit IV family [Bombardia bombarda]
MLRTTPSAALRNAVARAVAPQKTVVSLGCRAASTHAISNPTLANIEKRWEGLPMQEQAELWMALRDRMKESWAEMTVQEKKAAYWIAFGPHGPRSLPPAGEGKKVALYTAVGVGLSFVIFAALRSFAKPPPSTMTKEWQEETNEYLKAQNSDPLTGISSEGYEGKGHVQSPSGKP